MAEWARQAKFLFEVRLCCDVGVVRAYDASVDVCGASFYVSGDVIVPVYAASSPKLMDDYPRDCS